MLSHDRNNHWKLLFQNITQSFDKLILVGVFPEQIRMWEWDRTTGKSERGRSTSIIGHNIGLWYNQDEIESNNYHAVPGKLLTTFCIEDIFKSYQIKLSMKDQLYMDSPFSNIGPSARGLMFE